MQLDRRSRLAIVLVLSLLGVGGIARGVAPAGAAAPTGAAGAIDSEPGDPVAAGANHRYDAPLAVPTVDTSNATFQFKSDATTVAYTVTMKAPTGGGGKWASAATTYEGATKSGDATHALLDVKKEGGTTCTATSGRIILDEIDLTADPVVTKFVARFEQHCDGSAAALFGSVFFNGSTFYAHSVSPAALDYEGHEVGTPTVKTVTITNTGGANILPAQFAIVGTDAAMFSVKSNTCAAATPTSCTVDVEYKPTALGAHSAWLNFTDEVAPDGPGTPPADPGSGRDVALAGVGTISKLTVSGTGNFGEARVGLMAEPQEITLTNEGTVPVTVTSLETIGPDAATFFTDGVCDDIQIQPEEDCVTEVRAFPARIGTHLAALKINNDAVTGPPNVPLSLVGTVGYYLAQADGTVTAWGDALDDLGDASNLPLNAPVLGISTTSDGDGYWLVGGDGGIFNYGDAPFWGSTGSLTLNAPVLSLAGTPNDDGYWMAALDGGVFAFGQAPFKGSMGGVPLNQPVISMARTPSGQGYWLVALDGGIFAFGDAGYFGSMGGKPLNSPIVAMAATPTGKGYWLIALDGGIFAFGDAGYFGSMGGQDVQFPMIGLTPTPTGNGYWMTGVDGRVFRFGDAPELGGLDAGDVEGGLVDDVVGIAGTAPSVLPDPG
ncbi:MAG TPA: choice-of-anchor D domain-containing protein [Acidimicrobiales bacterium]|jgi:hypothetical protein|nr:choice-of-anchor D domain-containing protein [Acidimicrobiales bacterium]